MDSLDYEYPDYDDYEKLLEEERKEKELIEDLIASQSRDEFVQFMCEEEKHKEFLRKHTLNGITFNGKPINRDDW